MFKNNWLCREFNIQYPIIMAPMFLVSNEEMLIGASKSGIMGCIPALNYRNVELFKEGLKSIRSKIDEGKFGVNLIANKSNIHLREQIEACQETPPDFIITSLGSPAEIIKACRPLGTKVICDVVDLKYAKKVEEMGADAIIAVNSGAGGHAGNIPIPVLVPQLKKHCNIPVISAGGIGDGRGLMATLSLGADGLSIGSPFIGTTECGVNEFYKDAIYKYGAKDIVLTTKISGTPCTVIKTPYVEKIGTKANVLEEFLNKNKKVKKYAKMLTYYKGMKALEKAAFGATYKNVWCAGPSIEFVKREMTIQEVVDCFIQEYEQAVASFQQTYLD